MYWCIDPSTKRMDILATEDHCYFNPRCSLQYFQFSEATCHALIMHQTRVFSYHSLNLSSQNSEQLVKKSKNSYPLIIEHTSNRMPL